MAYKSELCIVGIYTEYLGLFIILDDETNVGIDKV